MTPDQTALLERLHAFRVDAGDESLTFVRRLARENGWSPGHAERVFTEYKRFAFLATTAGHPCTPSDQVDQAWHLHLTYTRSYWDTFRVEVLRTPLHHDPTKGGKKEGAKYHDWYAMTKASYRRFFGTEPPADIWPPSSVRFGDDLHHRRVNTKYNWIVPKPHVRRLVPVALLAVGMLLIAGCAQGDFAKPAGLFGVSRGGLLVGYLSLFTAGVLAAYLWRGRIKTGNSADENATEPELSLYEIAYLNGRNSRVFATAMVRLIETNRLTYDDGRDVVGIADRLPDDAAEAERAVYERVARSEAGVHIGQLRRNVIAEVGHGFDHLTDRGLMLDSGRAIAAMVGPLLLAMLVPLAGFALALKGLIDGANPSALVPLLIMAVLSGVLVAISFGRRPKRTRFGDRVLAKEQSRLAKRTPTTRNDDAETSPVGMDMSEAVAMTGIAVLHGTMYADLIGGLRETDDVPDHSPSGWASDGGTDDGGAAGDFADGDSGDGGCGGGCGGCS